MIAEKQSRSDGLIVKPVKLTNRLNEGNPVDMIRSWCDRGWSTVELNLNFKFRPCLLVIRAGRYATTYFCDPKCNTNMCESYSSMGQAMIAAADDANYTSTMKSAVLGGYTVTQHGVTCDPTVTNASDNRYCDVCFACAACNFTTTGCGWGHGVYNASSGFCRLNGWWEANHLASPPPVVQVDGC